MITNWQAIYILASLSVFLLFWLIRTERRLYKMTRGNHFPSIEEAIKSIESELKEINNFRKDTENYLVLVEQRLKKSLQGIHALNFNAFKGMDSGGQSFALALINEHGDGVILSSLSSRERISVFSKPIKSFESSSPLSEEERQALTNAKKYFSV